MSITLKYCVQIENSALLYRTSGLMTSRVESDHDTLSVSVVLLGGPAAQFCCLVLPAFGTVGPSPSPDTVSKH